MLKNNSQVHLNTLASWLNFQAVVWVLKETLYLKEVFAAYLLNDWGCPGKAFNCWRVPVEECLRVSLWNSRLTEAGAVGRGNYVCWRCVLDGRLWPSYGAEGGEEQTMSMVSGKMEKGLRVSSQRPCRDKNLKCPDCAKQGSQSLWAVLIKVEEHCVEEHWKLMTSLKSCPYKVAVLS